MNKKVGFVLIFVEILLISLLSSFYWLRKISPTDMKNIFLLSLLLIFFLSCHKESFTIINGTVTDAKTGLAIVGAAIDYGILLLGSGMPGQIHSTSSDAEGNFTIKYGKDEGISGFQINKPGYLTRFSPIGEGVEIIKGQENNVVYILHPWDANLRFIFKNSFQESKSVYLEAQCKSLLEVYGELPFVIPQPYPRVLAPNTQDTLDLPFLSDEMIYIYWDVVKYAPPSQASFQDSVYLSHGDTAVFELTL